MGRLSEFGTLDRSGRALRLDDIAGQEVTVCSFRLVEGQFGEYAFMDCTNEKDELLHVVTGAMFVLDALKDAQAKGALPINAMFVKSGRSWMIK